MTLSDLLAQVPEFGSWSHAEKIRFFAWYLHKFERLDTFDAAGLRDCFEATDLAPPSAIGPFLRSMAERRQPALLRAANGYKLERSIRADFDAKYGERDISLQITSLLTDLPVRIPDLAEKKFLNETLTCLKHAAFRATVVMAWNLALHHLCDFVLKRHLQQFNSAWQKRFPGHHKSGPRSISKIQDFGDELKESEIIEVCKSAGIISHDIFRILAAKLTRRNAAAHPSHVDIEQLQAEEFIDDLVKNVVLKLQ